MGIFDVFTTTDQQNAANAQIAGLNAGYGQASGSINSGIDALKNNYGLATSALSSNYGTAGGALTRGYGQAGDALTRGYGQAGDALTGKYLAALQPFLQNYGQAQGGVNQLTNLLGITAPTAGTTAGTTGAGPSVAGSILQTLQNTPGYQFRLQQGDAAINAQAEATGQGASGNQLLALSKYNQGLAGTTYQNAVQNLMPFLGASNAAAGGINSTLTGLGSNLVNLYTGLGSNLANNYTGLGGSLGYLYTGLGGNLANTYTGLGGALSGQYDTLANLGYQTQTGIGNANANADLAGLQASGNIWKALGSGAGLAASIFSDVRLKENIEPVGELYDGTNIFRYNYKGDHVPRIGVMAQEVEQTRPDAVVEIGGFKAVQYGKATDLAASLARFVDDKVVSLDDRRVAKPTGGYAADLARFLEAA